MPTGSFHKWRGPILGGPYLRNPMIWSTSGPLIFGSSQLMWTSAGCLQDIDSFGDSRETGHRFLRPVQIHGPFGRMLIMMHTTGKGALDPRPWIWKGHDPSSPMLLRPLESSQDSAIICNWA